MSNYLLLLAGLFLVLLEFYLPGGIMGTAGALIILVSIVLASINSASSVEALVFILVAIGGIIGVIRFALWHIRRTGSKNTIFLQSDQEDYRASEYDRSLVGQEGIAQADMRPGGRVLIEGKKYQALSLSGFISQGSTVKVIGGEGESLHVKLSKKEGL